MGQAGMGPGGDVGRRGLETSGEGQSEGTQGTGHGGDLAEGSLGLRTRGEPRAGSRSSAAPLSQPVPGCRQSPQTPPSSPHCCHPSVQKAGRVCGWGDCGRVPCVPGPLRSPSGSAPGSARGGWTWVGLCYQNPLSWAKSCPGESRGGEMRARRGGSLMPDECWPCERNYTGASLVSPKSSPEASGHGLGPLSQHPKLRPVPLHWQRSLGHTKPCPWLAVAMANMNGPSLPQFPHLENGCRSTHPTL